MISLGCRIGGLRSRASRGGFAIEPVGAVANWALALSVALAVFGWAKAGSAQMEFSLDEAESAGKAEKRDDDFKASDDADILEQLAGEPQEAAAVERGPAKAETSEEVYAVQQIYALRLKRFEIAPSMAFTLNDPFLSHPAAGLALNYWFTNVLAVGFNFLWYDFSFLPKVGSPTERTGSLVQQVQRSYRLGVPITEWQMGLHANFTYVPFYGKFQAFNKFIFQWDAYIIGGVGFMRTRPIPVFDPEIREFGYGFRAAFNLGIGIRIFLTRWAAIFGEFRNYMFLERFENTFVDGRPGRRSDPSTWFANGSTFFNNATIQVGATFFFPSKFKYRKPK